MALGKGLTLHHVIPDTPFQMRTDASHTAIGAVLEQMRVQKWVPVSFFSRKLTASQLNWSPREKEAYAIVASLVKWAGWIGTSPITVVTDHKSLESWVQEYVETPSGPTGRRARWHEIFSQFNLTIVYQPGATNLVADAMSRYAYPASLERQDVCRHGTALASQQVKEMVHEEKIQSQPNDTMTCGITMDPPTPTQEAYRLTSTMRDTVLKKLGVDKNDIQLDLFASEYNFTHPVYCTADMDAFSYSWDKLLKNDNHVIWANPPFSLLNQVVTKLIMEPCRMVLVTPEWRTETWWKPLDMITLSRVYVPAHLAIYQGDHDTKILPGPHWATVLSLVDTR